MDIKDVSKLAELSRIDMTDAEREELLHDMQSILGYVEQIESVAIAGDQVLSDVRNIMREDLEPHASGLYTRALVNEAPASEAGFIKVTQIFSDENA